MDALTHTAIGLLLARAGCNRWTPLATPILIAASNAPDVDYLSAAFGPAAYLRFHNGITHSLAAVFPLALACVLLVWLAGRSRAKGSVRWLPAVGAACLGIAAHLGLDATGSSGIALLAPFSRDLTRLDWAAWIDFVIWAAFALAVAGPFLSRLVGQEITSGALRQKWPGRGFPIFALVFVACYLWGRSVLHQRALSQLDAWNYGGEAAVRVAALPDAMNPWRWRALVETRGGFALADLNLLRDFDPSRATLYHKPELAPAIEAAAQTAEFRDFLARARFPLWRVVPADEPENASVVDVIDLAAGAPGPSASRAEALVSQRQQVLQVTLHRAGWRTN
jgi:inner membrane protein